MNFVLSITAVDAVTNSTRINYFSTLPDALNFAFAKLSAHVKTPHDGAILEFCITDSDGKIVMTSQAIKDAYLKKLLAR